MAESSLPGALVIPTEPIGSILRPRPLIEAARGFDDGHHARAETDRHRRDLA